MCQDINAPMHCRLLIIKLIVIIGISLPILKPEFWTTSLRQRSFGANELKALMNWGEQFPTM